MLRFAVIVLMVPLFCACSRTKTYSDRNGSVSVTEKGKGEASVHITGKDGKASIEINSGRAITDYPSDVPLYQGRSTMDMKTGKQNARSISLETGDSVAKIADFYKSELDSRGWKTEATMSTDALTIYTATKDNRQVVIQITQDGNKRMIMQHLSDKH